MTCPKCHRPANPCRTFRTPSGKPWTIYQCESEACKTRYRSAIDGKPRVSRFRFAAPDPRGGDAT